MWCSYHKRYEPVESFTPFQQKRILRMGYCHEADRTRAKKSYDSKKEIIIKMLGGKCGVCGYNKCLAALDFHHPDPILKAHTWTQLRGRTLSTIIDTIINEKCCLICANCHRELHQKEK